VFHQDPELLWLPPNLEFLFRLDPSGGDQDSQFLSNFLGLDDFDLFHALKMWRQAKDGVLRDLAQRFLSRRLYKGVELASRPELPGQLKKRARELYGETWSYYVQTDPLDSASYGIYRPGTDRPIRTLVPPVGGWQEISRATHSTAILGLSQQAVTSGGFLFFAPELLS
jgi:hypothetical protein